MEKAFQIEILPIYNTDLTIVCICTKRLRIAIHVHINYTRESLCSVLLALEHHLDEIATTGDRLVSLNELIVKTDRQIDIFKEAITTTDHPLISMQDKYVQCIIIPYNFAGLQI